MTIANKYFGIFILEYRPGLAGVLLDEICIVSQAMNYGIESVGVEIMVFVCILASDGCVLELVEPCNDLGKAVFPVALTLFDAVRLSLEVYDLQKGVLIGEITNLPTTEMAAELEQWMLQSDDLWRTVVDRHATLQSGTV